MEREVLHIHSAHACVLGLTLSHVVAQRSARQLLSCCIGNPTYLPANHHPTTDAGRADHMIVHVGNSGC